jgi:rRNA maturation endonuclease Nob1
MQGVSERATVEGQARAADHDVRADMQLVCPQCRAETHGAKFCPQCGYRMAQQVQCSGCATALQPGAKFCTECGQRQG